MRALPLINSKYWIALIAASIFGTNTGDMISEYFHLGNIAGLPYLAVLLAAIFLLQRISPWANAAYFWIAIIVIRTAATNIADLTHALGIWGVGAAVGLLAAFVLAVRHYKKRVELGRSEIATPQVDSFYWLTMALAGIVGTLIGDLSSVAFGFASYGIAYLTGLTAGAFEFSWMQTGHVIGTVVFGSMIAFMLSRYSWSQLTKPYQYWTLLALIRTGGTAAGDYIAHTGLGLYNSTVLTGFCFATLILVFYVIEKSNQTIRPSIGQMA
jgi:uncharacterized membrane-anchored protein